jgi:hypothetical protein
MVVPEKVAPPIMSDWSANNMGTTSLLRVMSPASQSSDFGAHDDAAGVVQCVVSPFDDRTMDTFFLAPNLYGRLVDCCRRYKKKQSSFSGFRHQESSWTAWVPLKNETPYGSSIILDRPIALPREQPEKPFQCCVQSTIMEEGSLCVSYFCHGLPSGKSPKPPLAPWRDHRS